MSIFNTLSTLLTLTVLLSVMSLVAMNNIKNKVNQTFIVFVVFVAMCVIFLYLSSIQTQYDLVLFYIRLSVVFANFMPAAFYAFTLAFIGRKKILIPTMKAAILYAIVLIPISFLPTTVTAIKHSAHSAAPNGIGPTLWFTVINFMVIFSFSFYLLINSKKNADPAKKAQVNIIVYTAGIAIFLNMVLQIVLPELHITTHENTLTDPTILLFVVVIGYSIIKHKLFDIKTVILRTFGFVFILLTVLITFSIIILVPSKVFFRNLSLSFVQELYFILSAVLLAFLFNPLRRWLQIITNRYFFQDHYDSENLVNDISKVLASEIRLEPMSKMITGLLKAHMNINGIDIIVLEKDKVYYESGEYYKDNLNELAVDLNKIKSDVINIGDLDENDSTTEKQILEKYGIQVLAQMIVRYEKVGYIIFSNKKSGSPYNHKDNIVINIVADELAVAIQNSRSFDQIRQFNASLQKKIEEATTQLLLANQELKEANSTKDDFISMVSHQLGTPLTVMEGFLTLILQGFYGKDQNKKDIAIKKALSRTRIMKNLVFDLLNISRMSAGKFFLELSTVNLNDIVSDEVNQLEEEAKDKDVILVYHPPEKEIPITQIDEPKTRQAIMNLINNAIFYSPHGRVDVYLYFDEVNITFKVVDNGIGVPEEQKEKLFTKFFRADNAVRESPNGTGIGLYLVKRVVEDQHGKIIFSSHLEQGSTFGFTIPIDMNSVDSMETVKEATIVD